MFPKFRFLVFLSLLVVSGQSVALNGQFWGAVAEQMNEDARNDAARERNELERERLNLERQRMQYELDRTKRQQQIDTQRQQEAVKQAQEQKRQADANSGPSWTLIPAEAGQ